MGNPHYVSLAQLMAFTHALCFDNCHSVYIICIFPHNGGEILEVSGIDIMSLSPMDCLVDKQFFVLLSSIVFVVPL